MNSPNLESDISISTVYTQQIMAQFNDLNILNPPLYKGLSDCPNCTESRVWVFLSRLQIYILSFTLSFRIFLIFGEKEKENESVGVSIIEQTLPRQEVREI